VIRPDSTRTVRRDGIDVCLTRHASGKAASGSCPASWRARAAKAGGRPWSVQGAMSPPLD